MTSAVRARRVCQGARASPQVRGDSPPAGACALYLAHLAASDERPPRGCPSTMTRDRPRRSPPPLASHSILCCCLSSLLRPIPAATACGAGVAIYASTSAGTHSTNRTFGTNQSGKRHPAPARVGRSIGKTLGEPAVHDHYCVAREEAGAAATAAPSTCWGRTATTIVLFRILQRAAHCDETRPWRPGSTEPRPDGTSGAGDPGARQTQHVIVYSETRVLGKSVNEERARVFSSRALLIMSTRVSDSFRAPMLVSDVSARPAFYECRSSKDSIGLCLCRCDTVRHHGLTAKIERGTRCNFPVSRHISR